MFMMCISVFAGCSLWERNDKSYFEATVATITYKDGSVDKISKRELITAFNSYGYNYVQNYGMKMEEAVKQTVESIIEKYLTIKDVRDRFKESGEELFNDREKSYLWDQTFDAIYSNLKTYRDDYKENSSEDSSETANASVFKDYESKIDSLEQDASGNWVIRKKGNETKIRDTYEIHEDENGAFDFELKKDGKYIYQDKMFDNIFEMTEEKSWRVAYNKYISDIKNNYKYKNLKGDAAWFKFEMNRVYEILRDNYIAEKYEDIHNTANQGISSTTANDILKAYSKRVRADYTSYISHGDISGFESSILSSVGDVDYVVESKDNANVGSYFYVAPIKINVEGLAELNTQRDNKEISLSQYEIEVKKLFDKNKQLVTVRNAETGEADGKISVNNLYSQIQIDLNSKTNLKADLNAENANLEEQISQKRQQFTGEEENDANLMAEIALLQTEIEENNKEIDALGLTIAELYRKYFYLYNDDDSNKGKDYNAVFGVDKNGKAITSDTYKDDAIKTAIESLYNNGKAQIGDISEIVQAEDGFYIFFYAGKVENLFEVSSANFDATIDKDNLLALAKKKINVFSSKTLLDVLFDELDSNNFSVFQTLDMNNLRKNKTKSIDININNIKDLYK